MLSNAWLALGVGLVLLAAGGEALVYGAVGVSRRLGVSPLLVGLVLVGFGTSSPELTASVAAALRDSPGIAVGNVVGSNITNLLLILGVGALIHPLATHRAAFTRDASALAIATISLAAVCAWGLISRPVALVFLCALIAFVAFAYVTERKDHDPGAELHRAEAEQIASTLGMPANLALAAAGILALVGGSSLLVDGGVRLATEAGIDEAVIGLTIIALGTSLPELATTVVAAIRRQADVAVGNLIGSNLFNCWGIIGVAALVRPLEVPAVIAGEDIWLMLVATACTLVFIWTGWRLQRWEGGVLLGAWLAYMVFRLSSGG